MISPPSHQLDFSVIVPTYRRPSQLARCLQALASLDYPRDRFEVIVVDDGTEMPQANVVAPFRQRVSMTLLTQENSGPAAARNRGAGRASGRFLAFTDDDCVPAPDWLRKLQAYFLAGPCRLVGGRTVNALYHSPYAQATQLLIDYLYKYYQGNEKEGRFFTSNNLAVPRDLFLAVGGFDSRFRPAAEDREFCHRWLRHGYGMTYAPDVVVYHFHALEFWGFCRQHFNYGRGAFRFHHRRAEGRAGSVMAEPLSFYVNLLGYPFSQSTGWRTISLALLLFVSQAANAAGFFWEMGLRSRNK